MKTIQTEPNSLSPKQRRIIPFLVSYRSVEEARKAAGVCQETVWRWMKQPAFRQELDAARERFINEALDRLKSSVTRAVDVLAETMTGTDATLRVRAAGMVLDHFFRVKEIQEFETRLKAVEDVIKASGKVRH
jgi:hypothetical protein